MEERQKVSTGDSRKLKLSKVIRGIQRFTDLVLEVEIEEITRLILRVSEFDNFGP